MMVMSVKSDPVGAHEMRHVTKISEGDLVWDGDIKRWRKVTLVTHYVALVSGRAMVKIVLDMSVWHRHVSDDDGGYYAIALVDVPADVAPLSATDRRRAARRGEPSEADHAPVGAAPHAAATVPADQADLAARPPAVMPDGASDAPVPAQQQVGQRDAVRARREVLRLSRGKLAELSGVTPGALWRIENGRPKDDELDRVSVALDAEEARCATT